MITSVTCEARQQEDISEIAEYATDFLIVGEDISEAEAESLRLEIRPGPDGTKYVWTRDIDPE